MRFVLNATILTVMCQVPPPPYQNALKCNSASSQPAVEPPPAVIVNQVLLAVEVEIVHE